MKPEDLLKFRRVWIPQKEMFNQIGIFYFRDGKQQAYGSYWYISAPFGRFAVCDSVSTTSLENWSTYRFKKMTSSEEFDYFWTKICNKHSFEDITLQQILLLYDWLKNLQKEMKWINQ